MQLNVHVNKPSRVVAEALQSLRTNIMYMDDVNVISFTSTLPDEGKSVISFYLANAFASIGKKTLFIDCDMRKSKIKKYFSIEESQIKGLSEYITRQSNVLIYTTNIDNLDIIPSGKFPPDPSGLLSSEKFETIVNDAYQDYDYIIIDTPPVISASDASVVGRIADGVIYVVRDGYPKAKETKYCAETLKRNGCRILGAVNNMIPARDSRNYYYYYYYENE
ncbi:MAG: CpsD/CapB family tyrosine-protein kinase [Erysipelotrichaceae bacterium]